MAWHRGSSLSPPWGVVPWRQGSRLQLSSLAGIDEVYRRYTAQNVVPAGETDEA